MQELIKQMSYNRDRALGAEKDAYNICILYAENMLEKEKEVLIETSVNSYTAGYLDNQAKVDDSMNFPEQYYNETFNNEEK